MKKNVGENAIILVNIMTLTRLSLLLKMFKSSQRIQLCMYNSLQYLLKLKTINRKSTCNPEKLPQFEFQT